MLSLCITSIIRPVTLWSINLEDVTCESQVPSFPFALHPSLTLQESNVSVALWNIIEAELDFVAGNVPPMGPLLRQNATQQRRAVKWRPQQRHERHEQ